MSDLNSMVNATTVTPNIEQQGTGRFEVAPDVLCVRTLFVNFHVYGEPGAQTGRWVLIDTGLGMSFNHILDVAAERFGAESRPRAPAFSGRQSTLRRTGPRPRNPCGDWLRCSRGWR